MTGDQQGNTENNEKYSRAKGKKVYLKRTAVDEVVHFVYL